MRDVIAFIGALGFAVLPVQHNASDPGAASLNVIVTAGEHRTPVHGLTTGDFSVMSHGSAVAVERVTSGLPVSLVLLLDLTTSVEVADFYTFESRRRYAQDEVERTKHSDIATSLDPSFVPGLVASDRIRVAGLGRRILWSPWLQDDRDEVSRAVAQVLQTPAGDRFGPSPIWDAVDEAVSALHLEPGWKHILLLTDGLATGNMKSMEEVVLRAASSDVTIHVVESGWLVKRDQSAAARSPHHAAQTRTIDASAGNLRRLATETGGLYLPRRVASAESQGPQRPPAVGRLFRQILDAIHAGYRLTVSGVDCEAPTDAQDVRVPSAPGASVHFRPNGLCGRRGASP